MGAGEARVPCWTALMGPERLSTGRLSGFWGETPRRSTKHCLSLLLSPSLEEPAGHITPQLTQFSGTPNSRGQGGAGLPVRSLQDQSASENLQQAGAFSSLLKSTPVPRLALGEHRSTTAVFPEVTGES